MIKKKDFAHNIVLACCLW